MNFVTIENKRGKIRLNEHVHQESIGRMIEEIGKLFGASAVAAGYDFGPIMACAENAVDTLDIEINSPGGSVFDGYTIFNEIKSLRGRGVIVTATITGMAASMASVIAMACDSIRMVAHGRMMIHDAANVVAGNAEKIRVMADLLDGISSDIATIYAARTGKAAADIRTMMKKETWMNAKESKALGFIDEILTGADLKNAIDFATTAATSGDMKFLDRLTQPSDTEAQDRITALESTISQHDQTVSDLQAKLEVAETALQEASGLAVANATMAAELADKAGIIENQASKIIVLTAATEMTEAKVSAAAAQMLAAQGHGEPLNLGKSGVTGDPGNTKTRVEFNSLTPREKQAFCKSGGTLTE